MRVDGWIRGRLARRGILIYRIVREVCTVLTTLTGSGWATMAQKTTEGAFISIDTSTKTLSQGKR